MVHPTWSLEEATENSPGRQAGVKDMTKLSAEGAAPCIHIPTSESRFKLEISRGWLQSGGKITLLPISGITLETSPQWSAVYKKR